MATIKISAQSFFLTQSTLAEQDFNSVLIPYNTDGSWVLDSMVISGKTDVKRKMIPTYSGLKITSYQILNHGGVDITGTMNITFNGNDKPSSYKTTLNYLNYIETIDGTIAYSNTGKQNSENLQFSYSDLNKITLTKEYFIPFWEPDQNDIDSMQIDLMGGDNHNHNLTAFRFGGDGKLLSFKSVFASDSAVYHYNGGLLEHIHYANEEEVEYYWSPASKVKELERDLTTFYPNPSNGEFIYYVEKSGMYDVYNITGNKVLSVYLSGQNTLDLTSFGSGVYFLKEKESGKINRLMVN